MKVLHGGNVMPGKYQHVQQQLEKISKMLEGGMTQAEVAKALGLSGKEVIHNLLAGERKNLFRAYLNSVPQWVLRLCKTYGWTGKGSAAG